MAEKTQDNLSYQKVLGGLLRMHELSAVGDPDADEIKQLRDAIDEPYSDLSAAERETIEGLSTDLFDVETITSEPVLDHIPPGDNAMAGALQAQYSEHYDEALKLLREKQVEAGKQDIILPRPELERKVRTQSRPSVF